MKYLFKVFLILSLVYLSLEKKCKNCYEEGDEIPLISDRVWPTSNPSETYNYYSLSGFCKPRNKIRQSFGAELTGSSSYVTNYKIQFKVPVDKKILCSKKLTKKEVILLRRAVHRNYFTLMYFDSLPVKFPLGIAVNERNRASFFLYKHLYFEIYYSGDKVIEIKAKQDQKDLLDLSKNTEKDISFSYSINWVKTEKHYHDRWDKYVTFKIFPEEIEIQWFSILNSLILVVVLTCFVVFIMNRILSRDYAYYDEEENRPDIEQTGWKLIHSDVFRFPPAVNLLAAIIGNGTQLILTIFFLLLTAALGFYLPDYGNRTLYSALVIIYVLTTGISGYMSGKYYKQLGGKNWIRNVILTVVLFILPCFLCWCVLNTTALFYQSTAAFSFKLVIIFVLAYCLVSFPFQLIGAITAKNWSAQFKPPCRTKISKREIPPIPWYKRSTVQIFIAGFLPFGAVYIELYYFYLSIFGNLIFTPFIVLLIFFLILMLVTSCISIAMTYIQISQEDWRWWWRSIFCGGAPAFFVFIYSIFYWYAETTMEGFFQLLFYFGYNLMISYCLFLMLSTVGFLSSLFFVKRVYRGIKID